MMIHRLILLAAATLAFLPSCTPSMDQICGTTLPQFQRNLEGAIAELRLNGEQSKRTRGLASVWSNESLRPAALDEEDRQRWQEWAEARLKETQKYIDLAEFRSVPAEIRHELSELANDLVAFHGYAQQGKLDRMMPRLEKIRARSQKAQDSACHAP